MFECLLQVQPSVALWRLRRDGRTQLPSSRASRVGGNEQTGSRAAEGCEWARAAEEAQRQLAVSEAERQAVAHRMEHDDNTIVENVQKLMQHAEANAACATDETH
eukprot:9480812-Pyramimonas_sp.AAC.1